MCPHCRSDRLRIRNLKGFERFVVFFTGKRQYLCTDCGKLFRMIDRRGSPRALPTEATETYRAPRTSGLPH